MDSLNRWRIIPADGKLSAEINAEHSARQQIEHEPKGRQPIRRLEVEIKQQPAQTAKDLKPPHPPPHQIAQLGSVVGPHPRHQPPSFEFRSARHALPTPRAAPNRPTYKHLQQNVPRGYTTTNHRATSLNGPTPT